MKKSHKVDKKQAAARSAARTCSARPAKEKGITRCDYERNHGFRAYIKFKGKEYQRFFGDKGAPDKALAHARRWRKLKLRELQNSPAADNPLKRLAANNRSGITGVHRTATRWSATWVEGGRNLHRNFAVEKHGERVAFRQACRERAEAEKRLYGRVIQPALRTYVR